MALRLARVGAPTTTAGEATVIDARTIDHVAVAVDALADAVRLFCDVLGGEYVTGGDDERLGIRTLQVRFPPGVKIELMTPIRPDSHLHRFLEERGGGFHHLTIFVEDLEKAIEELTGDGYEVVETSLARAHWKETFMRPRSGFGTLLQLAETDLRWDRQWPGITLEAVLAGDVVWTAEDVPRLRSEVEPTA